MAKACSEAVHSMYLVIANDKKLTNEVMSIFNHTKITKDLIIGKLNKLIIKYKLRYDSPEHIRSHDIELNNLALLLLDNLYAGNTISPKLLIIRRGLRDNEELEKNKGNRPHLDDNWTPIKEAKYTDFVPTDISICGLCASNQKAIIEHIAKSSELLELVRKGESWAAMAVLKARDSLHINAPKMSFSNAAYAYFTNLPYLQPNQPNEDTPTMNTPTFEVKTFVNDEEISGLSDEQLIQAIIAGEKEISRLNSVGVNSTAISNKIEGVQTTINKIVEYLDSRTTG